MATDEVVAARQADLDRMLAENELDRRNFSRVFPSAQNPVFLELEGQTHKLRDISGGGLSFFAETTLFTGWIYSGRITLPTREKPLAVKILIIDLGSQGLIRGRLQDPEPKTLSQINSYVEQRQKELLSLADGNLMG